MGVEADAGHPGVRFPHAGFFAHRSVGVDDPGNSHGRYLYRRAPGFDGPEARHVELLARFGGIAERRIVRGNREEARALANGFGDDLVVGDLEANRRGDAHAPPAQRHVENRRPLPRAHVR